MRLGPAIGALLCAAVLLMGGCFLDPDDGASGGAVGDRGTGEEVMLVRALGRVAATDASRQQIVFGDTGRLAGLTVGDPRPTGFGDLSLLGAPLLAPHADTTEPTKGIAPRSASYTVSAGVGPTAVALLAGGQHADTIRKRLAAAGWTSDGDRLIAPATAASGSETALRIALAQVRPDHDDLVYGGSDAPLADAGTPKGTTLADDRRVRAVAACLGDVVAAQFVAVTAQGRPTMVAVGVRHPNDRGAAPRAVACAAWPTAAAADAYAGRVRNALAHDLSQVDGRLYADLLRAPTVDTIGGDEHVVAWAADTPTNAGLVVEMLLQENLPALPDCDRAVTPLAKQVCG